MFSCLSVKPLPFSDEMSCKGGVADYTRHQNKITYTKANKNQRKKADIISNKTISLAETLINFILHTNSDLLINMPFTT